VIDSIILKESSADLESLCRSVEAKLSRTQVLSGMLLPVELLEDFDDLPEATKSQAQRHTSAAYRRSTKSIYINRRTFMPLHREVQESVLAHEIGHALAHRDSLMKNSELYSEFGAFGEEFLADRLACEWGFFDGVRMERIHSYGAPYVKALEKWEDETEYCKAMKIWHIQKLAGIV
jgi:hypothetical protein